MRQNIKIHVGVVAISNCICFYIDRDTVSIHQSQLLTQYGRHSRISAKPLRIVNKGLMKTLQSFKKLLQNR